MWQTHYQTLLNSVKTTEHKERVLIETSETSNSSQITFTPIDISNAFKSLKIRKSCGVDGVSAEHFLYAHDILHVFLVVFSFFEKTTYCCRARRLSVCPSVRPSVCPSVCRL